MSDLSPAPKVPIALTIAGSDSGAGAGIQADLKTFAANNVYGCSVITAITAQNTQGVQGLWSVPAQTISAQISSVMEDMPIAALKIGMLFNEDIVDAVLDTLMRYSKVPTVVDPVFVATSGDSLVAEKPSKKELSQSSAFWKLIRYADLVTPNLNEAAQLLNDEVSKTEEQMRQQGLALIDKGLNAVLIKGGHLDSEQSIDLFFQKGGNEPIELRYSNPRIKTKNTHGTGCTLSSAIAANLANNINLPDAIENAKRYVSSAILFAKDQQLGNGCGPVHHFFKKKQIKY